MYLRNIIQTNLKIFIENKIDNIDIQINKSIFFAVFLICSNYVKI